MIKVLPFTCIKKHFEGEFFAPVDIGGEFELQSSLSVLVGSNGNAFRFKNADNANVWIDSNLIRASKQQVTTQTHIDALIVKNSISPHEYLQTEIDILLARNAGEWGIYFSDELTGEFGIIAKGDKGDTGAQGAQGVKGDTGEQGIQGLKGDTGLAGANGAAGIQGLQGAKGDTGEQGIQGVKGDTGTAGANGAAGIQGVQGLQGVKGDAGAQGVKGDKGDTGAAGANGAQGIQGVKGDAGSVTNLLTEVGGIVAGAFNVGSAVSAAHNNNGVAPDFIDCYMQCVLASQGYAIGDKFALPIGTAFVIKNTTTVTVVINSAVSIPPKTGGAAAAINGAAWKIYARCWRIGA